MDIKLKTLSMHQLRGFAEHEPYVNPISLLAPDLYLLLGIEIPLPRQFRKRQLGTFRLQNSCSFYSALPTCSIS